MMCCCFGYASRSRGVSKGRKKRGFPIIESIENRQDIRLVYIGEGFLLRLTRDRDDFEVIWILLPKAGWVIDLSNLPSPATATVHHPRIHRGLRDPSTVRSGTVGYHIRHSFFKLG